ncbi:MAG: hypothetical protein MHPSP_004156, partial [Paramarteilia canceri]
MRLSLSKKKKKPIVYIDENRIKNFTELREYMVNSEKLEAYAMNMFGPDLSPLAFTDIFGVIEDLPRAFSEYSQYPENMDFN